MTPDDERLTAQDFTGQRNEAIVEGVRALFWMNGGGSVALLAFLQSIWGKEPQLAIAVVGALGCFAAGMVLAGLVHFLRFRAAFHVQEGRADSGRWLRGWYEGLAYLSLVAFVAGVVVLLVGAWCALR